MVGLEAGHENFLYAVSHARCLQLQDRNATPSWANPLVKSFSLQGREQDWSLRFRIRNVCNAGRRGKLCWATIYPCLTHGKNKRSDCLREIGRLKSVQL